MDSTVKTLPIRPMQADNDSSAPRRPSREEAEAAVRTLIRWAGEALRQPSPRRGRPEPR